MHPSGAGASTGNAATTWSSSSTGTTAGPPNNLPGSCLPLYNRPYEPRLPRALDRPPPRIIGGGGAAAQHDSLSSSSMQPPVIMPSGGVKLTAVMVARLLATSLSGTALIPGSAGPTRSSKQHDNSSESTKCLAAALIAQDYRVLGPELPTIHASPPTGAMLLAYRGIVKQAVQFALSLAPFVKKGGGSSRAIGGGGVDSPNSSDSSAVNSPRVTNNSDEDMGSPRDQDNPRRAHRGGGLTGGVSPLGSISAMKERTAELGSRGVRFLRRREAQEVMEDNEVLGILVELLVPLLRAHLLIGKALSRRGGGVEQSSSCPRPDRAEVVAQFVVMFGDELSPAVTAGDLPMLVGVLDAELACSMDTVGFFGRKKSAPCITPSERAPCITTPWDRNVLHGHTEMCSMDIL